MSDRELWWDAFKLCVGVMGSQGTLGVMNNGPTQAPSLYGVEWAGKMADALLLEWNARAFPNGNPNPIEGGKP